MFKIPLHEAIRKAKKISLNCKEVKIAKQCRSWEELVKHPRAPYWLYWYAKNVIKGRWLEAEPYIMKDPEFIYWYASTVIKDRWPEAEKYIIEIPQYAYYYAKDVIKDRWLEAEEYIMKGSEYALQYFLFIRSKWFGSGIYLI